MGTRGLVFWLFGFSRISRKSAEDGTAHDTDIATFSALLVSSLQMFGICPETKTHNQDVGVFATWRVCRDTCKNKLNVGEGKSPVAPSNSLINF